MNPARGDNKIRQYNFFCFIGSFLKLFRCRSFAFLEVYSHRFSHASGSFFFSEFLRIDWDVLST